MSLRTPGIDHLVVLADHLAAGVRWCEHTLGLRPAAGGEHALMGTHNRLLNIASAAHPHAYLEIIAVQPGASGTRPPGARRWFDMDDPALRERMARHGPQLVHWVASVPDIRAARAALAAQGIERGEVLVASRPTAFGLLQWQITVREDGQRLFGGCLPTLIEWGERHPSYSLPASGVQLQSLRLAHPDAGPLARANAAIGLDTLPVSPAAAPRIEATLATPDGPVVLTSATTEP